MRKQEINELRTRPPWPRPPWPPDLRRGLALDQTFAALQEMRLLIRLIQNNIRMADSNWQVVALLHRKLLQPQDPIPTVVHLTTYWIRLSTLSPHQSMNPTTLRILRQTAGL